MLRQGQIYSVVAQTSIGSLISQELAQLTKKLHMHILEDSKVYRGGVSTNRLRYETGNCSFEPNPSEESVDFSFVIDSKGGGETEILFQLSSQDLRTVLKAVAEQIPGLGGVFAECALLAGKKDAETLEAVKDVERVRKERLEELEYTLAEIRDFVVGQYNEAPDDDYETESEAVEKVEELSRALGELKDDPIRPEVLHVVESTDDD